MFYFFKKTKCFNAQDIRVMEIYGMSECTGPQVANVSGRHRLGTLGHTVPGLHTRLGEVPDAPEEAVDAEAAAAIK